MTLTVTTLCALLVVNAGTDPIDLYWEGRFQEALDGFTRQARTTSGEEFAAQQLYRARCLFALRQEVEARHSIALALGADPLITFNDRDDPPALHHELDAMRATLTGTLEVVRPNDSVKVLIDGELLPFPARSKTVPIGWRELLITDAAGKELAKERVLVRVGKRASSQVQLEPLVPPQAAVRGTRLTLGPALSVRGEGVTAWPSPLLGPELHWGFLRADLLLAVGARRTVGGPLAPALLLRVGPSVQFLHWFEAAVLAEGLVSFGPEAVPGLGASGELSVRLPPGLRVGAGAGVTFTPRVGAWQAALHPFFHLGVSAEFDLRPTTR